MKAWTKQQKNLALMLSI